MIRNHPQHLLRSVFRLRLTPLLLLMLALAASPSAAQRPEVRDGREAVRYLGTQGGTVRFEVRFDEPVLRSVEIDGTPRRVPSWAGLLPVGPPGDPAVPARIVRVAVPPQGALSLRVETSGGGDLRDATFLAIPGIEPAGAPRTPRDSRVAQAEILSVGVERGLRVANVAVRPVAWDPERPAAAWASEVIVTVSVDGAAAGGLRGRTDAITHRLREESLLNPADAAAFAAPDTVPPPGDGVPDVWFDDGTAWFKIEIAANGIYTIDRAALEAFGVPAGEIDPRTFRLFAGPLVPDVAWGTVGWDSVRTSPTDTVRLESGWRHVYERPGYVNGFGDAGGMEEVSIEVAGEADGSFDAGDRIVFYALGPDNYRDRFGLPLDTAEDWFENPYTDRTVYWLTWGGTFPAPARRMETVDATPQPAAPLVSEAGARAHGERNRVYSPLHQQGGFRWEQWFWEEMTSTAPGYQFRVPLPGLALSSTLDFHLRLWGVREPIPLGVDLEAQHNVQVTVNDQDLGVVQWGADTDPELAFTPRDVAGTGIPARSPADFVFRLPDVPPFNPQRVDRVFLAWIDVDYRRLLDLASAPGELSIDAGDPGRRVGITSLPPGTGSLVLDVTDFRNPRRLTGAVLAGSALQLSFDGAGAAVLAVTVTDSLKTPAGLQPDDLPLRRYGGPLDIAWLRDITEPVDYLIIAYDDFLPGGEYLASWRRTHLHGIAGRDARVRVVRVSDIMDEFAAGMMDPAAIRYFLEYAYRFYGAPGDDRLAYCLFLGDHNYDFRNYLGTGTPVFVPSWEDTRDPTADITEGNVQYASDDPLARFDGRDPVSGILDPFTDLYIGRIPASSREESDRAVQRIVSAEETPNYGPWRARALLVTDDLCQAGAFEFPLPTVFVEESEAVDALYPAAFDRRKIQLVDYGESCTITTKPQARQDLLDLWNEGAWLVNYVGHGSEFAWADEQVLTRNALADLDNEGRLPVVIATASKTGWFNRPGSQGLAESLLLQPGGGALASTGSGSDFTYSTPAFRTNESFATLLFPGGDATGPIPVGAAFLEAKQPHTTDGSKYHFFGDPAMLPPVPLTPLTVTSPDSLGRGLRVDVGMQLAGGAQRTGAASVRAEDAREFRPVQSAGFLRPGERIFEGEATVTADTARASFVVPALAAGGDDARIRAYAWGMDWDALGARFPLPLGGTPDPMGDTEGPAVTFPTASLVAAPGQELEATLEDPSGIKLAAGTPPPVELAVTDDSGAEVTRLPLTDLFAYERDSSTRGTVRFPVPEALEDGPYTFTVFASDNFDNRSQASLDVTVSAAGGPLQIRNVYAYPNPNSFAGEPTLVFFTLDRPATLDLHLYTVKGRLVLEQSVDASAGQNIWSWNGRDAVQDEVSNGVYLLQLKGPADGGDAPKVLERLVVLR